MAKYSFWTRKIYSGPVCGCQKFVHYIRMLYPGPFILIESVFPPKKFGSLQTIDPFASNWQHQCGILNEARGIIWKVSACARIWTRARAHNNSICYEIQHQQQHPAQQAFLAGVINVLVNANDNNQYNEKKNFGTTRKW